MPEFSRETLMDLALRAAVEVERMVKGLSSDRKVVTDLIEAISMPSSSTGAGVGPLYLEDPRVVTTYGRVVQSIEGRAMSTVQDVRDWLSAFIDQYQRESGEQLTLSKLRDFCLALHRELRQDIINDLPEPFGSTRPRYDVTGTTAGYAQ
jgi:hypothetical protein